jgi:hypothetical protein
VTRKLLLTALFLGGIGAAAGVGAYSAFVGRAPNTGNTFASGSLELGDNDGDAAMLSLAGAKPGDTDTSCITVRSKGTLDADVRLYATTAGTLPPYLTATITRGTGSWSAFDNCAGFAADAGGGVLYSGPLSAIGTDWATGIVDALAGAAEVWTAGEEHTYRISVTPSADPRGQGKTGTATFTWEARSR